MPPSPPSGERVGVRGQGFFLIGQEIQSAVSSPLTSILSPGGGEEKRESRRRAGALQTLRGVGAFKTWA